MKFNTQRERDNVPNARITEFCGVMKRVDKGLVMVFSDDSVMCREWRMAGLLRGSMWGSVLVVPQRLATEEVD